MKFAKLLEMWKKFLDEHLEEECIEEEILDEEEDFQDKVKDGYVKKRNKYLKSGPQSPGSAYPEKTKDTRAESAPGPFGGS
jgi:hypothetical protein